MLNFWQKLPKPFLALAPLDDVTDVVFREIIAGIAKPDVFYTEFTSADGLCSKGKVKLLQKFKYTENQRPIVAQIWGKTPENLYKAAKLVKDLKFDGVDINMGCPDKTVMKQGCGASLIGNNNLTKEIIDSVKRGAKNLPVSIKTRLGAGSIITKDWIGFLLDQKLDALIIHARTAAQMSQVPANWQEIGRAVKLKNKISPKTILIGNGDILSFPQALQMHKTYGVDGVMIGRGIFANPWVFEKTTKVHAREEYLELLLKHLTLFEETWGKTKNYQVMKKFFKMYIHSFEGANQLRQQLMETTSNQQAAQAITTNT
ncbi:MAG: tRNA-dihydrouridine synthase [Candidatus Curtissbacteria bacterium]|nr:tRNA-dihydrouridine synthase [Candidatus Curtissbacteria bacterium]